MVWDRLVELGIFVLPAVQPKVEQHGAVSPGLEKKEERPPPATLPRYEGFSPASSGSLVEARFKVHLACLQLEREAVE